MARKLFVTPDGKSRRQHAGDPVEAHRFQDAIDLAEPGDTISVLPGVYDEPVVIRNKRASLKKPITIMGDGCTTLDGRRVPLRPPGLAQAEHYAFIKVLGCAGIVIDNMTIQNVWPTAIYIENSQEVTVRRMNLNGATYGVFARGEATERLLLERCSWIQDDRIWDQVSWKDIHHPPLPRRELDGDFFRSSDIAGKVIIRHNFIAQAFNAVHFFAPKGAKPGRFNTDVWIYRNTFTFIRDNAVEAEYSATNWWVFENKIYNCHTWFAFEQCNGGHIYLFSNRGWFDRKPGPPGDCHAGGGVLKPSTIKMGEDEKFLPKDPVYVFNNSWYLRSTYLKKGKLRNFHHFNNAIEYPRVEYHPPGVVDPARRMIGVGAERDLYCEGPGEPEEPFTKDWKGLDITFENDVCNHPDYPERVQAMGHPVAGRHADPAFEEARHGRFGLLLYSPCREAGHSKQILLRSCRKWQLPAELNIGAMNSDAEPKPYAPLALGCPPEELPCDYREEPEA